LDGLGNWQGFNNNGTTQTREHNEANEITSQSGSATPTHDAAGNMTQFAKPTDSANALQAKYDAWNRMVEVSEGGVLIAKYSYDANGRRIIKAVDTNSDGTVDAFAHFLHNNNNQVLEVRTGTDTTGSTPPAETLQPKYQNIWSPRYIDAKILRSENTDTDGLCDDAAVFYLSDANYNVTAVIDGVTGNVIERYAYDPYGKAIILDADFTPDADNISDINNTTLYTGRELDQETGLYFYRARYYHGKVSHIHDMAFLRSGLQ
jgi:RHS repeat-associated protein